MADPIRDWFMALEWQARVTLKLVEQPSSPWLINSYLDALDAKASAKERVERLVRGEERG